METTAKARFMGDVRRVWSNDKIAIVTVGNGKSRFDVVAFKTLIQVAKGLREGDDVEITCDIWSEALKDRARQDVIVDGYTKWVPKFVASEIVKLWRASAPPRDPPSSKAPASDAPPVDDDMPNF